MIPSKYQKQFALSGKTLQNFMIRIIFPNGFPVSPPPVPLAMSCFVPVLRFLRFAWNDGNKKIDFLNDIYPSVGKRDILRVAYYHARFYSPSSVWTHHFDRCEFSHCSSQKSCAIYLYRNNSHVGVRWEQRTEWNLYSKFGRQTVPYLLHRLSQLFPFFNAKLLKKYTDLCY